MTDGADKRMPNSAVLSNRSIATSRPKLERQLNSPTFVGVGPPEAVFLIAAGGAPECIPTQASPDADLYPLAVAPHGGLESMEAVGEIIPNSIVEDIYSGELHPGLHKVNVVRDRILVGGNSRLEALSFDFVDVKMHGSKG